MILAGILSVLFGLGFIVYGVIRALKPNKSVGIGLGLILFGVMVSHLSVKYLIL